MTGVNSLPRAAGGPAKFGRIAASLRRRLLRGEWPHGQRLPTRVELMRAYRTTAMTIQKALDVLADEGLVRADGRRGTFARPASTRGFPYAIAFPFAHGPAHSQFYRALREEAQLSPPREKRFVVHDGIADHPEWKQYRRLVREVRQHRLAGLVFAFAPHMLVGSPLLDEPHVPRVAIMQPDSGLRMPTVYPDLAAFRDRALTMLASRGCRRVAGLFQASAQTTVVDEFERVVAAHGLTTRRCWLQAVPAEAAHWAAHVSELLLRAAPADRPDALVITDDTLVPAATAGLKAAGVTGSDDFVVVAHTNFPWPTPAAVPVIRLGFDVRQLLAVCVERIEQQRRGEAPPSATLLPPVWEGQDANRGVVTNQLSQRSQS